MKAAVTIFLLLTLGLGAGLFLRHKKAVEEETRQQAKIRELSVALEEAQTKLDDQERISLMLRTNLTLTSTELEGISNNYVKINAELLRTQAEFKASTEAAKAEQEAAKLALAKKDAQIGDLENQGTELTGKISGLESSLGELNKQIAATESQLAASEGDREFLLKELKRMQTEKAELEKQFNDLSLLRKQVAKLKEELSISRRLEWIRMGIYGSSANKKGAELLMSGIQPTRPKSNYNLNVEIRQDGGATILSDTNALPK